MSWHGCLEAECKSSEELDPVELIVVPRTSDVGGFEVRRALPSRRRRLVGPFIFFDQMGPSDFVLGQGLDVGPHPHIGLATVTYMFRGEILHRDSLGTVQPIRPGEVNWMTAGRGIAHSERTPLELRSEGGALFGIQAWVALPEREEECRPAFVHHPESELPLIEDRGITLRVITGAAFGERSPVAFEHEAVYLEAVMAPGCLLPVDVDYEERALYVVEGMIEIGRRHYSAGRLLVLRPGDRLSVTAVHATRVMLLGGAPMDSPRYIWWNFVSSRKERIEQAKADWQAARFERVVDEREFIPLPDLPGP